MCACPKPRPKFLSPYVMIFFLMVNELRLEVIIRLVDHGRLITYHRLNFLFHIYNIVLLPQRLDDMHTICFLFHTLSNYFLKWLVMALWFYCSKNLKLFVFPIVRFWVYLMKVIPETRRVHKLDIYIYTFFLYYYSCLIILIKPLY